MPTEYKATKTTTKAVGQAHELHFFGDASSSYCKLDNNGRIIITKAGEYTITLIFDSITTAKSKHPAYGYQSYIYAKSGNKQTENISIERSGLEFGDTYRPNLDELKFTAYLSEGAQIIPMYSLTKGKSLEVEERTKITIEPTIISD